MIPTDHFIIIFVCFIQDDQLLNMERLLSLGRGMPGLGQGTTAGDAPAVDTAEQVYISSLALLKVKKC